MGGSERRAFARLEILDELNGRLVPFGIPVTLRDISAGGFSLETEVPFPIGAAQHFRFTTAHGDEIQIEAEVMHCTPNQARSTFLTGFAFVVHSNVEWMQKVRKLLDAVERAAARGITVHTG